MTSDENLARTAEAMTITNTSAERVYAIVVTDSSMMPRYELDELVVVDPTLTPTADVDCVFRSESPFIGARRGLIKRLVRSTDSEFTVRQYNPDQTFILSRREWTCHQVVSTMMSA